MRLSRSLALAAVVLPAATFAALPQQDAGSTSANTAAVPGIYACMGMLPDGSPYTGRVAIARTGETWQVVWLLDSGEQYFGIGVITDDVLAVTYFSDVPGIVAYHIVRDGSDVQLTGDWTMPQAEGRRGRETLVRVGDGPAALFKIAPQPARHGRSRSTA